jgi:recombination protein RecA
VDRAQLRLVSPAPQPASAGEPWALGELTGRLCELSGDAALTLVFGILGEAQRIGEPAAWIGTAASCFFPPDAADGGIDLDALLVVRAPSAQAVARTADQLARSSAFGLLILDLANADPYGHPREERLPPALLSRLLGLAQKHSIAILFLTDAPLGSLVSLRAECLMRRHVGSGVECELVAQKDKRRAPGWTFHEVCRGPAGLR